MTRNEVGQTWCDVCQSWRFSAFNCGRDKCPRMDAGSRVPARAAVEILKTALRENIVEIRQQSGVHYVGCTCTFCSVVARSDAAIDAVEPGS